jgi:hypothetical protein
VGGDVLPAGTVLTVKLEQEEVLLVAPFLAGEIWIKVVMPTN